MNPYEQLFKYDLTHEVTVEPTRTVRVPLIYSAMTERVFLVISYQFMEELRQMFLARGCQITEEKIDYLFSFCHHYERVEKVLIAFSQATGIPLEQNEEILPMLEKVAELLEGA